MRSYIILNMKARRKDSLAKAILLVLEKTVDGYVRFEDFANNPGFYVSGMRDLRQSSLSQALKRLRESGLIEQVKLKDDVIIKLTEAGRDLIADPFKEKDWDGKWRKR